MISVNRVKRVVIWLSQTLTLPANIREALFEIPEQILAFTGNVNGLFLAVFCANPRGQRCRRGINKPPLTVDRHPLVLPALNHRWCLPQEFCDLSPAFQDLILRLWLRFRHRWSEDTLSIFRMLRHFRDAVLRTKKFLQA